MRVVLDANALVSALVFHRDRWSWLRDAWKSGTIVPLLCAETARELIRVLAYPKFQLDAAEQQGLLEDLVPQCETVAKLPPDTLLDPCRDPQDQIFLRLAHAGSAAFLVSGDDDLLTYKGKVSFQIISPGDFRSVIANT